jgi:predicted MFS family arabinose efflux permease
MLVCLSLALLAQATITLFVVRALTFALDDGGVGLFYAAVGVGSVTGGIVAGAREEHAAPLFPAAIAMGICAIALAVFGVAGSVLLSVIALIIAGFATDFYEVIGLTFFQGAIPDAVYARFFSVFLLALSAGGLVGAVAGPVLERVLGVGMSLVILALPSLVLASALGAMSKNWRHAEWNRGH